MSKDGHAVAILSGDLTVEQRISVLDRFRAGLEKVLITTNVLARGTYTRFNVSLLSCRIYKIINRCASKSTVRELHTLTKFYDNLQVST